MCYTWIIEQLYIVLFIILLYVMGLSPPPVRARRGSPPPPPPTGLLAPAVLQAARSHYFKILDSYIGALSPGPRAKTAEKFRYPIVPLAVREIFK
jgi:hypothetical protein